MPGLPYFDATSPQLTRAPTVEITIGGGSADGGFGGIVDAAASLLGGGGEVRWADHLIELSLQQGLAPRVDCAELLVAQGGGAPEAALGDSGQIRMGAPDALEDLFSGSLVAIERRGDGTRRYRLCSGSHQLAQTRLNQNVTNMSVQDATSFAAAEAGLSVDADVSGSDGILAQYAFDDSRSLWEHMAYLAGLRGCSLWFDAADALHLANRLEDGDPVATLRYGDNLLEINLWQRTPHSGAITAFGGGRDDDGFTLRKQAGPNRATSGDGIPQRFYRDGVLQSQDELTARVAAAALTGQWRATAGELLVSGSAAIGPGRVVEVFDLPDSDDGRYLVLAADHRFDQREGWRTRLSVAPTEQQAAGGLSGLAGGPP